MKKRRLLALASLLLALAVVVPGAALAKRGGTDRPLKGSGSGTTTVNLAASTAVSEGTAQFSHFGKSTYRVNVVFTITGPNTFTIRRGRGVLVAANGDRAISSVRGTGTFTGIGVGETSALTLVFNIVGGTGRFADARGTLTATVSQETISLVGTTVTNRDTFTARGRISY